MPSDDQTNSSREVHCIHYDEKAHNQQQAEFLSPTENGFA
jgi:hypothetical protein